MRVCFFVERQVGIGSVSSLLKQFVGRRSDVDATWCDVTYHEDGGLIERLPAVPRGIKSALRALQQMSRALERGPFDALFFLTHNPAILRQDLVGRVPTCLWTDVTPVQLDGLAWAYAHEVSGSRAVAGLKRALVTRTFRHARRCLGWSDWARRSFVSDY